MRKSSGFPLCLEGCFNCFQTGRMALDFGGTRIDPVGDDLQIRPCNTSLLDSKLSPFIRDYLTRAFVKREFMVFELNRFLYHCIGASVKHLFHCITIAVMPL